jgi:hypothetical protein
MGGDQSAGKPAILQTADLGLLHYDLVEFYKCALGCTVKCSKTGFTVHWGAP